MWAFSILHKNKRWSAQKSPSSSSLPSPQKVSCLQNISFFPFVIAPSLYPFSYKNLPFCTTLDSALPAASWNVAQFMNCLTKPIGSSNLLGSILFSSNNTFFKAYIQKTFSKNNVYLLLSWGPSESSFQPGFVPRPHLQPVSPLATEVCYVHLVSKPPLLISHHPGLPSPRTLVSQVSTDAPTPWCLVLGTFNLLSPPSARWPSISSCLCCIHYISLATYWNSPK